MNKQPPRGWRVLESEYLSRRPWLTVRSERLQMPDGRVILEYYVFKYPDWVNTIAITVHLLTLDQVRELLTSGCLKQATHLAPLWKYIATLART